MAGLALHYYIDGRALGSMSCGRSYAGYSYGQSCLENYSQLAFVRTVAIAAGALGIVGGALWSRLKPPPKE